jgi:hypothetical protein
MKGKTPFANTTFCTTRKRKDIIFHPLERGIALQGMNESAGKK